jgi:RNA polymerase sigma-70 factor (ECF subfamily)
MCRNEADADDVLQDALLSIAQHLDGYEGRSSLASWAFAIARSACSRKRRGKKNEPTEGEHALADRATDEPLPDDHAASRQLGELVTRSLDELSDEHREVLLLRDVEGMTAAEASAVLGISVDALKSRLHRARTALRESLRPLLDENVPTSPGGCPDVVRALSQKLEDELDADACAEMEKHVLGCPSCAKSCDTLKDALRACKAMPAPKVTPEIAKRVRSAVDEWLLSGRRG